MFVLISYVTKLFVLSKKGQIACCIMVLSKTDIIVYVICGQHSLFHRWRTSPETCQEVQIKSLESNLHRQGPQADCLVKGSEISHSNITTSSNFRVTTKNHLWLVFESPQNGPVPNETVEPVDPSKMAPSLGVRTPNLDNCHLDSAWPSRPATVHHPIATAADFTSEFIRKWRLSNLIINIPTSSGLSRFSLMFYH